MGTHFKGPVYSQLGFVGPGIGGGGLTPSYWSGYHNAPGISWEINSATIIDPIPSGAGATIAERVNGNFGVVTTAASDLPGITFTPIEATAVYEVSVNVSTFVISASQVLRIQLTDGTTIIEDLEFAPPSGGVLAVAPIRLVGIYACSSAAAVTLKLQAQVSGGTPSAYILSASSDISISWTLVRIA